VSYDVFACRCRIFTIISTASNSLASSFFSLSVRLLSCQLNMPFSFSFALILSKVMGVVWSAISPDLYAALASSSIGLQTQLKDYSHLRILSPEWKTMGIPDTRDVNLKVYISGVDANFIPMFPQV
jgi:hypothetical protein